VPGPGSYQAPDSCIVRDGSRDFASYRSTTQREANKVIRGIPGVGVFNANEQFALGTKQI